MPLKIINTLFKVCVNANLAAIFYDDQMSFVANLVVLVNLTIENRYGFYNILVVSAFSVNWVFKSSTARSTKNLSSTYNAVN